MLKPTTPESVGSVFAAIFKLGMNAAELRFLRTRSWTTPATAGDASEDLFSQVPSVSLSLSQEMPRSTIPDTGGNAGGASPKSATAVKW